MITKKPQVRSPFPPSWMIQSPLGSRCIVYIYRRHRISHDHAPTLIFR